MLRKISEKVLRKTNLRRPERNPEDFVVVVVANRQQFCATLLVPVQRRRCAVLFDVISLDDFVRGMFDVHVRLRKFRCQRRRRAAHP